MKQILDQLYEQAWQQLDQSARQTWLAMLFTTNRGATYHSLHRWSGLSADFFCQSLEQLERLDLIEVVNNDEGKFFRVHGSIRDFLNRKLFSEK